MSCFLVKFEHIKPLTSYFLEIDIMESRFLLVKSGDNFTSIGFLIFNLDISLKSFSYAFGLENGCPPNEFGQLIFIT